MVSEEPRRPLKIQQNAIDGFDIRTEGRDGFVAVPVGMNHDEKNGDGPHKLHGLGKASQIIFLLHGW